ncbi:ALG5 glucosyltransferase, partial [Polypterus senegalus]
MRGSLSGFCNNQDRIEGVEAIEPLGQVALIAHVTAYTMAIIPRQELEKTFLSKQGKKEPFPSIQDQPSRDLSVIVPSYNEELRLPVMMDEALDFLEKRQKKDPSFTYEVIVVDDGSKDKTTEVALKYTERYGDDKVRVLTLVKNRGKGGAVKLGTLSCRGKYILMADADGATKFADIIKVEASLKDLQLQPEYFQCNKIATWKHFWATVAPEDCNRAAHQNYHSHEALQESKLVPYQRETAVKCFGVTRGSRRQSPFVLCCDGLPVEKGEQVITDPIEDDPSKELTWHREQYYLPVVATIQPITLPFPDRDDKSRFIVIWDDAYFPNESKDCLQSKEDNLTTGLEKFTPVTTDPCSLPYLQLVHHLCNLSETV